jgi:type IV pilus assembly protein PilA
MILRRGITHRNPISFPASTGFTLIELMIVVAIIAIILTLALPVYSDYSVRAKIAEALSVSNAAKTAVATTCQEDPTIAALTASRAGYSSQPTKYVASITFSGPCTAAIITVATQQTGAFPNPNLTITGTMKQGHMGFVCVSSGLNKHVPRTCRS